MKNRVISYVVAIAACVVLWNGIANGQCNEKVSWNSNKWTAGKIGSDFKLEHNRQLLIVTDSLSVTINNGVFHGGKMKQTSIKCDYAIITCFWQTPFRDGKLEYRGAFTFQDATKRNGTLTITQKRPENIFFYGGELGWSYLGGRN